MQRNNVAAQQSGIKPIFQQKPVVTRSETVPGQLVVKIDSSESTAEPSSSSSTVSSNSPLPRSVSLQNAAQKPQNATISTSFQPSSQPSSSSSGPTVVAAATAMSSPTTLVKVAPAINRITVPGSPLKPMPGTTKIITIGPNSSAIKYTPVTFSITGAGTNGKRVIFTPHQFNQKKPRIETVSLRTLAVGTAGTSTSSLQKPVMKMEIPSLPSTSSTLSSSHDNSFSKRRRRTTEDGVKGLRYFATKVCDKVREKNLTTYNSVAEDLVAEYSDPAPIGRSREEIACEQKNIRRRVYDALNVLMAINVIQKERKQIRWVGLPRTLSEAGIAKRENPVERKKSLSHLRQRLFHSALQLIALKELAADNKRKAAEKGAPRVEPRIPLVGVDGNVIKQEDMDPACARLAEELEDMESTQRLEMPFLLVTTGKQCEVNCSVSTDAKEFELRFSQPFKIIEDTEVLRHIPLVKALDKGQFDLEQVSRAVKLLPPFMQVRFVNLLTEHQERLRKAEEMKRQEMLIRQAALAERERQRQERVAQENLAREAMQKSMSESSVSTSSSHIGAEVPLSEATVEPRQDAEDEPPLVTPTPVAPIADVNAASPMIMKPKYYIQVAQQPTMPK